jgi:DNA mismatch repair protein MutS
VKEQGNEVIFLRRVIPGGTDRSYGVYVARLAGLPGSVVRCAEEIMARLELERGKTKDLIELGEGVPATPRAVRAAAQEPAREADGPFLIAQGTQELLLPTDDVALRQIIQELFGADVANMTPVQALIQLNDWQQRLRGQG